MTAPTLSPNRLAPSRLSSRLTLEMAKQARTQSPTRKVGRRRRATGWALLLLGVVIAGAWLAGGCARASCEYGRVRVTIAQGTFGVSDLGRDRGSSGVYWNYEARGYRRRWQAWRDPQDTVWYVWLASRTKSSTISFPNVSYWEVVLWPLPLLLWPPAVLLLRSGIVARRRANTETCPTCGYSLAWIADDAPCPECGKRAAGAG